jgi:DNA modification methylase
MKYEDYLKGKFKLSDDVGFRVERDKINPALFDFQKDIVAWALRKGKAAIFASCGSGKTLMQLEWAQKVHEHTGGNILIVAPLAVAQQTVREGAKFGYTLSYARRPEDRKHPLTITNYEHLEKFLPFTDAGIVLDESGILKSFDGKTRTLIIGAFKDTAYRLACTATPAPNDYMELGNHAQFLGVMTREEMLATYFIHDGGETQKWRLKTHGREHFWKWLCSWGMMIQKPSDIDYPDGDFILPALNEKEVVIKLDQKEIFKTGVLFAGDAGDINSRRKARRESLNKRVLKAVEIVEANPNDSWLLWCDLNSEGDLLQDSILDSVQVAGKDDNEFKADALLKFASGETKRLISKPSIAGHGLNMQVCHNVIFVGISDSFEAYYQAVRRCWRFGQKEPVNVYIIISESEVVVLKNIRHKQKEMERMAEGMRGWMTKYIKDEIKHGGQVKMEYEIEKTEGESWKMMLGDCVEECKKLPPNSIDYSIWSPPFAQLYTYSASERDMGNCKNNDDFIIHFRFLIQELLRIVKPGRVISFHCMNIPMLKSRDGYIGIMDFRGKLIREFLDAGWIFSSEVCIWKDPVTAMQRTKSIRLLYKQLKKDSCMSGQGLPDYLITMRKPGENPERVTKCPDDFPVSKWQQWASPIWMDIKPSKTLQKFKESDDERHIAPLQLEVIERGVVLWSNPGDLVFSPFAGIGSEGYESIRLGRRFLGIELKRAYYEQACRNLRDIENETKKKQLPLLFAKSKAEVL